MSACNDRLPINTCNGNNIPLTHPKTNQKQYKMSASSYIDLKKSMTVISKQGSGNYTKAQNQKDLTTTNGITCVSNVGGPGDAIPALEKRGLVVAARKDSNAGVDRKHGSYARYLARKQGWNMVNLECN